MGRRLSSWERQRRADEAAAYKRRREKEMEQQKAATKRRREEEAAARRANTAARRKAERELKEQELASTKKTAIQKDNLARASMNQLMNTHIENIHPYYIISPSKVSEIENINIYKDFIPKSPPVFSKNKAPTMKKAVKAKANTFVMPEFNAVKKEIRTIEKRLISVDKERNFSIKDYLRKVGRSGFIISWVLNKENERYKKFIIKAHDKYKIYEDDINLLKKSLTKLKADAKKKHHDSEANKELSYKNELKKNKETYELELKAFEKNELARKKKFDADLIQWKKEESNREKKHNDSIIKKDKSRREWLKKLSEYDNVAVQEAMEFMFPLDILTDDVLEAFKNEKDIENINCGFIFSKNEIKIAIRMPETFKFLPKEWLRLTPSGADFTTYIISDTEITNVLKKFISSLGLAYLRACFEVSNVKKILLEISVLGDDPLTGNPRDIVLLKMNAMREKYEKLNLDKVDPSKAIRNFKSEFKPPLIDNSVITFDSEIESEIDLSKIQWCDNEDSSVKMDREIVDAILTSIDRLIHKKLLKKNWLKGYGGKR